LKTRCRPENLKPGNEKLNSRFRPEIFFLKPGKGHFLVYFNKSINRAVKFSAFFDCAIQEC
jgi:hypothetical protein